MGGGNFCFKNSIGTEKNVIIQHVSEEEQDNVLKFIQWAHEYRNKIPSGKEEIIIRCEYEMKALYLSFSEKTKQALSDLIEYIIDFTYGNRAFEYFKKFAII